MESNKYSRLIQYVIKCGIKQSTLVDHFIILSQSELTIDSLNESLIINKITPEIVSMCPNTVDPAFPLSPNFVDVFLFYSSFVFHLASN